MNKGLFASFDKLALRKNMLTDLREIFFAVKRVGLHYTLLKSPSFIYAAFRAERPEKMAKSASSSESWVIAIYKEFDARRDLTRAEQQRRAVDLEETAKELGQTFLSLADANGLILLASEEAA